MNKKIVIIITAIVVVAAALYGLLVWKAIDQANNFQPSGICGTSITRARHNLTGITFDFSSTCVPDGWHTDRTE